MRLLLLLIINCSSLFVAAQKNLFIPDSISGALHQSNIGRLTFMKGNIPLEQYKQSDILQSFRLSFTSDLNVRFFLDNSIANYLHQLAPDLSAEELLERGNLQFAFYVDQHFIYKENIGPGCTFGNGSSKNTSTILSMPLISSKDEDFWGLHMWDRFKLNGGEKALGEGSHKLSIEVRPYLKLAKEVKAGDLIAQGQIELIVKAPTISRAQIQIQAIQPNSGWDISDAPFDTGSIERLNKDIAAHSLKEITSIIVIKDNKLMLEEYFNGADRNTLHDTRSVGKSFTSTLMGMAINDGYIKNEDQMLGSFYQLQEYANYDPSKDSIKIKDLLTMSSGLDGSDIDRESPGNEENMYPTEDWVKFTLDLKMDTAKTNGARWDYFTAGVVVLGDILDKNIPGGLESYAAEKLFKPLGITHYQWQYTPQKVVNTAGGLQMRSLDDARYAQLYQNKGVWKGRQILPASWVQKTLSKQIQISGLEDQYYGYLFWNKTIHYKGAHYETYYCAGNGGNEFILFKSLPLVIIITSKAYNKPYGHAQSDKIVREYLLPAILK